MSRCSQAVILAAGIGSRLKPITLRKPKSCVSVGSEPILARQLRAYAGSGVERVYVVAGYMRGQVSRLCDRVEAEFEGFEVTVVENEVYANTDNLYSLSLVREAVEGEPFVLSNGDVVFDPEICERIVAGEGNAVSCDTSTYDEEAMKVTVDGAGHIDHISKDVSPSEAYATSTDLYRFSPSFSAALFDEIDRLIEQREGYTGWTEMAIDRLLGTTAEPVEPLDIAGLPWVEVDDYDDLTTADIRFADLQGFDDKRAVFLDLDGTVYLDEELVPGAQEVIEGLRARDIDVYFLSNNSSQWKTDYAQRLRSLGIEAAPSDVLLSTDGVIEYLRSAGDGRAFVVGTTAMREAMREHGIELTAEDPRYVVVGFDTELTYEKVRRATLAIRDGAEFLLAHPDMVCPTSEGFVPDCGSIGAMVEAATDRTPARIFGKPNPEMIQHVLDDCGYAPAEIVVVGDRLETEVEMAHRVGCDSVCVLTGDADRVDVEESGLDPSLVVPTVGALAGLL